MNLRCFFWCGLVSIGLLSCMDQYNPRPYWNQFKSERETTSQVQPALTPSGEIPPKEVAAAAQDPLAAKFSSLCSSCHGQTGKADGAASAAM
ncbi:MAG: hypothetical protein NTV34_17630, partial [Proteobacteria bacterium]|nr:hypothetical protein [Pseudomonadota bacterium]